MQGAGGFTGGIEAGRESRQERGGKRVLGGGGITDRGRRDRQSQQERGRGSQR